jgi:hypothetical protein
LTSLSASPWNRESASRYSVKVQDHKRPIEFVEPLDELPQQAKLLFQGRIGRLGGGLQNGGVGPRSRAGPPVLSACKH